MKLIFSLPPYATVLVAIWSSYLPTPALAILVNFTVDDVEPVIQYSPSALWNDGRHCDGCTARPDIGKARNSTWHDSTHKPASDDVALASLQFTGSAIYVFCIIAHSFTSPDGTSDIAFWLDGQQVGVFTLAPTGQTLYEYNVPVYANGSIPPGKHTIIVQNGRRAGPKSLLLLDYMIYSAEDLEVDTTSSSKFPSTSPSALSPTYSPLQTPISSPSTIITVAAIVLGTVALLIGAGVISFLCVRHRRRQQRGELKSNKLEFAQSPRKHEAISSWALTVPRPIDNTASLAVGTNGSRIARSTVLSESEPPPVVGWSSTPVRTPNPVTQGSTQTYSALSMLSHDGATIPTISHHPLQHSDAARTPTSGLEVYHGTERRPTSAPPSLAEHREMLAVLPFSSEPHPARPGTQIVVVQVRHTNSMPLDVPPAYVNISRDDALDHSS